MRPIAIHARPPILTTLALLASVVVLAPKPTNSEPVESSVVVAAGTPHGDLYIPPAGVDPLILHVPASIDPHMNLYRGPIPDVGLDDVVSGFMGLLTPPMPPHC